ncbi:MAG: transcriptional regulator NrdR [Chloroflexota bacterium]|nr:transcriptional regulator NrdR [Anaerolineae bacterium]
MRCPYCGSPRSRVVDTRSVGAAIRRRRQCRECAQRFTTYERVAKMNLLVVKRDGRREEFDRQKLFDGILNACAKRPVSSEAIEDTVARIEMQLYALGQAEVSYRVVGETVMDELRNLDEVAYVRFASVYRHFTDLEDMKHEVDGLLAGRTS